MKEFPKHNIGVIIPYYNAQEHVINVVEKAHKYASTIIVVNDCSPDSLPTTALKEYNVIVTNTIQNSGVGGAMKQGFKTIFELDNIEVVVKLDADDQMDTSYIPQLLNPIIKGKAEFVKGNRFRDLRALRIMPINRRFGNLMLSFLSKMATGYWHCFDFNNGFFAISKESLKFLDFKDVSDTYFFETSLIACLYHQKARVKEVAMPAIYGEERSNMKVYKMPYLFLKNLIKKFFNRLWKAYFLYDFNIGSVYIVTGLPLFIFGIIYGGVNWYHYASIDVLAPLGTIMVAALTVIFGFQLLLQAVQYDIFRTPK